MIRSHWVRPNAANRIPTRWIWWDTEATERVDGLTKVQTWRLGVTCYDHWNAEKGRWVRPVWATHSDSQALWQWVVERTSPDARTIMVAHNVAYDLRIADAFRHLPALGWNLDDFSVGERSSSLTWAKGKRKLALIDSYSWLPHSLARIGSMVGMLKPELTEMTDPDDDWERRCTADVAILRNAFMDLLSWVRDEDLGNWQKTGAGQSWATWRHRFYTHRVLIHDEQKAQDAEAAATYTGRCEAWRHGELPMGEYTEWDLPLAYPRVALDTPLPRQLAGWRRGTNWRYVRDGNGSYRFLVRATVDQPEPILPVDHDDRTLWPIGRVEGWWWDNELRLAEQYGARIQPHEMYRYDAAPYLAEWAQWVIGVAEETDPTSSPVRAAAAKHQARALIGRFASKHQHWEENGPAIDPGVGMHRITDVDTATTGRVLTLGGDSWVSWQATYADNAFPAVMSAVMSECRIRLWQLMIVAGLSNVVYVDTDSLITNRAGSARLRAHLATGEGWGLRSKGKHRVVTILAPRQLYLGSDLRASGMPSQPFVIAGHQFGGSHWEGLPAALLRGHTDRVVIRQATWTMTGRDNRREHYPDGSTRALCLVNPWLAESGLASA
jgi:hypothetical protein